MVRKNLFLCLLMIFFSSRWLKSLFAGIVLMMFSQSLFSQGCSDAGACSLGAMSSNDDAVVRTGVQMSLQYARGEQNVQIGIAQFDFIWKLNKRLGVQVKIPRTLVKGNIGSTYGWGDITIAGIYRLKSVKHYKLDVTAGFKYGVNNAAKSRQDFPSFALPMPYQTSLGTHDVMIGGQMKYKRVWNFGLALQIPVFQFNKNGFDTTNNLEPRTKQYFSSYHLFRRPDAVVRIDKTFIFAKKFGFTAGALAIYHLGHDRALTSASNFKTDAAISGSKGLTLNIPLALTYDSGKHWEVAFKFAAPVIVRRVRPDGLTRHFVTAFELKYNL